VIAQLGARQRSADPQAQVGFNDTLPFLQQGFALSGQAVGEHGKFDLQGLHVVVRTLQKAASLYPRGLPALHGRRGERSLLLERQGSLY
jgi:hypothetical protein